MNSRNLIEIIMFNGALADPTSQPSFPWIPSERPRRSFAPANAKVTASSGVNDRESGRGRGVLASERHPFIPPSLPVSLPSFPPPDDSIASPEEEEGAREGGGNRMDSAAEMRGQREKDGRIARVACRVGCCNTPSLPPFLAWSHRAIFLRSDEPSGLFRLTIFG